MNLPREHWAFYKLSKFETFDVRFPTSDFAHGSDAVHVEPDYSAAYIIITFTNNEKKSIEGHGMTFSLGRGNEILIKCIESLMDLIKNMSLDEIWKDMKKFINRLNEDSQMRWLGPNKGVLHMSSGAIINSIFDIISWCYNKPLWKLIIDMDINELISMLNFQYMHIYKDNNEEEEEDIKKVIYNILNDDKENKLKREKELYKEGFPLYTTAAGWIG
ncbi:hypothetical protein RFI_28784 [Reticulomyxa filosa]|uniref:Uncharacterized protein n=1 Tax=Reticulomyxa filosa TaxID=46433 RepID=X6M3Q2_RETFI|nr:hypothetical protein RFI_28784 [Reticulomyxa filosa]|eukprot:ETO08603.1 hypothetical protein RFI_28784 [Reticulomyxa filosa]